MRLFYTFILSLLLFMVPSCMATQVPQVLCQFPPAVELVQTPFVERAAVVALKYQQWFTLGAYVLSIVLVTLQARKNGNTVTPQQTQATYTKTKGQMGIFMRILKALVRRKK